MQRTSSLVINNIAPGFAICGDWMYIKNSRKGLFDNESQDRRIRNSEIAKNIIHVLYEAQRNTYFGNDYKDIISKREENLKSLLEPKFKQLYEKIDVPINYSKEEIILSEVTLGITTEFIGRTFADTIKIIENNPVYNKKIGAPFTDAGYHYYAKYLFEICYHLYTLNTKLGVIHGDFHLNNAVIGPLFYTNYDKLADVVNPCALYIMDDENQYLFPTTGYISGIIDFSRSIIQPDKISLFNDYSLPRSYSIITDYDQFIKEEINMLIRMYTSHFPNRKKQIEELLVLFKNH
jgi:hypothetical protein